MGNKLGEQHRRQHGVAAARVQEMPRCCGEATRTTVWGSRQQLDWAQARGCMPAGLSKMALGATAIVPLLKLSRRRLGMQCASHVVELCSVE